MGNVIEILLRYHYKYSLYYECDTIVQYFILLIGIVSNQYMVSLIVQKFWGDRLM